MKNHQDNFPSLSALLRAADGVDALETNSLCCAAAGIIAPSGATTEALIPHEKLRGAALTDATLNAQKRSLAQPAEGGKAVSTSIFDVTNKPVSFTKVVKKSVNHTKDMGHWDGIHTIGNHEYRSISAECITRSHDPSPRGHGGKPNGGWLDCDIGISIWSIVFERVRYFTAGAEAWAESSQIYLEIRFGRRASLLSLAPNFTLRFGPAVPNPLANVESSERTVDCKIARSRKPIRSFGNVTALQLTYLPAQLQQHVADTFHLKRVHRFAPSYPRFERCATTHRRAPRPDQYLPSIPSMSHDSSLRRQKI